MLDFWAEREEETEEKCTRCGGLSKTGGSKAGGPTTKPRAVSPSAPASAPLNPSAERTVPQSFSNPLLPGSQLRKLPTHKPQLEDQEGRWHWGYPPARWPLPGARPRRPSPLCHFRAMRGAAGPPAGPPAGRGHLLRWTSRGSLRPARRTRGARRSQSLRPAWSGAVFIGGSTSLEAHVTRAPRHFLLDISFAASFRLRLIESFRDGHPSVPIISGPHWARNDAILGKSRSRHPIPPGASLLPSADLTPPPLSASRLVFIP